MIITLNGKFTEVNLDRLFPTDPWLNIREGIKYQPAEGEELEDVLDSLNDRLESWWRKKFPHMAGKTVQSEEMSLVVQREQASVADIEAVQSLEELQLFQKVSHDNQYLGLAYKKKYRELVLLPAGKKKPDATIEMQYSKAIHEGNQPLIDSIVAIYDMT